MQFISKSAKTDTLKTSCLVLPVFSGKKQHPHTTAFDMAHDKIISSLMKDGDIEGKAGQTLVVHHPSKNVKRILLIGCGELDQTTAKDFAKASHAAWSILKTLPIKDACSALSCVAIEEKPETWATRQFVLSAGEALYQYTETLTENVSKPASLQKCQLLADEHLSVGSIKKEAAIAQAIANGIKTTKTLSNLPGNICTPSYLAEQAKSLSKEFSTIKTTVLEEKKMEQLGMGALLSVSRGSRQPAKLITMEYNGGKAKEKPVVIVGKGLTFDAGGISIKPSANMDEMKYDMCGGATVFGVMRMCAELNLPINVVGVVPSSENLPDGDANKPGDIVTSMAGLTIEVLNTDAEGRLILCDALTYSKKFNPEVVIDIATLTGACVVALGKHATGVMSNNDALANDILNAGINAEDKAWPLPIWDEFQDQLKSNFADLANIGGPAGGTITAACFLSRFTEEYKWAHMDIAGTAWKSGAEKGATGRPVHLLSEFLLSRC